LNNPATAKEAAVVNQSLTSDLTRNEDMNFRDSQARQATLDRVQAQQTALEAKSEELKLRMQERGLDRASREAMAEQQRALQLLIAQGANATRLLAAQVSRSNDGNQIDRKAREMDGQVERLSRRYEPVAPMINAAQQVQDMLDSYRQEDGKYKNIPGVGAVIGSLPPILLSKEGGTNRQKIQMFGNAMLRAQAGLSQTLSEQEKATLELMASGKFRQEQFEAAWPSLMEKVNSTVDAIGGGYTPEAVKMYNDRGGSFGKVAPKTKAGAWKVEVE
jgi:outer membrane murein-binding lipoprotein Lpp